MRKPIEQARNGASDLLAQAEERLAAGLIDEEGWHREVQSVIVPAYLSGETPWEQSGKSGGYADWEHARRHIADAIDRDGTFLDIGCASGLLMEDIARWCGEKGIQVQPYGLDISLELADLARRRLPRWADRIFVGNGLTWQPPRRFDFVRAGLEYVPLGRRRELVEHILQTMVEPGGRLILGNHNEEIDRDETADLLESWGYKVAGKSERVHRDPRLVYRVVWIDA